MVIRCGGKEKSTFVFFNTGLEYDSTKRQIKHLEEKYGIEIQILPPIKPIPLCVREYGLPFWSKRASEYIYRLQRHGFQWEDEPFDVLLKKYPRCKAALRWWCNAWPVKDNGQNSNFNISYTPWLKEFMIENPPDFKISAKCCHYAKKEPVKKYIEAGDFDLNCTGIRKAEGGARATAYSTCYTQALAGPDQYRPLFWFTDADKVEYDQHYGVTHSDCYRIWGMDRTGCAGCPFGKDFEQELALAEKYEPKFHRAMLKVFGPSYEYTRRFLEFRERMKTETKGGANT
jgi:3'-phosphoadenosine 5'-phosphosulfate sulfotransferase (PAPS reductase)/FAD synthetase